MRILAVILVFSLPLLNAGTAFANAGVPAEMTYSFVDNYVDHSTERNSGFSMPQLSSSSDYETARGVITVVRHEPDSDGVIALDISERVKVGDPPQHEESYATVTVYLRPDGVVDQKRQFDQLTAEEVALAHFLIPNLLPAASQKTWRLGGVVDRMDDRTDYTLLASDPDGTAVLTFEQRVKGPGAYTASGKVLYDGNRRLPLKAHTEIHTVDLSDTMFENIDFALAPN